jgi:hypothetical protein
MCRELQRLRRCSCDGVKDGQVRLGEGVGGGSEE